MNMNICCFLKFTSTCLLFKDDNVTLVSVFVFGGGGTGFIVFASVPFLFNVVLRGVVRGRGCPNSSKPRKR